MSLVKTSVFVMVGLSCVLLVNPVSAQEPAAETNSDAAEPPQPFDRLLGAELQLAIDGPLGVAGAALWISPFRYLALDLGGGVSRDGYRFGGGLRLRAPVGDAALGIRVGLSAGPLTWDQGPARRYWELQTFFNAEINFEVRFGGGPWYGLVALGVEEGLSGDATSCSQDGDIVPANCGQSLDAHPSRPYVSLSVGYAFDAVNHRL